MGKAIAGEGSIKQRMTGKMAGKWRVQFDYTDPENGQPCHVDKSAFVTQGDAAKWLRELKDSIRVGEAVTAGRSRGTTAVGAWFDWLYENEYKDNLDPKTRSYRKTRFETYARPVWDKVPLLKVDPLVVRNWYKKLLEIDEVGEATVHSLKADMVRMFNLAITPYGRVPLTAGNPFAIVLKSGDSRAAIVLTPEEAKAAFAHPMTKSQLAQLGVHVLAGLRLGEQMALTAGQILFEQDLIFVDRAVKLDEKGRQYVGLPKGNKKRIAVLTPSLKSLLIPIAKGKQPEQYLFPATLAENQPRMKTLTYATWRTIVKDAGLPETMVVRDCRLNHINWIEKLMPAVSPMALKEHVGHAAEGVTQVNYTRPLTPAQTILRDEIERVVGLP